MTNHDRQKSSMVQDTQEVEQGKKKPYHTPALRVCGTVKQCTQLGTGDWGDGVSVGSEFI